MSQTYTFAFVDLAGFTALTDAHGDETAADYIARFTTLARTALTGSTRIVNVIGDAVLLVADRAEPSTGAAGHVDDALTSTLRLLEACLAEPGFPLPRGGIHTGSAVRAGTDYLGSGVNVAARITALAAGGELILTEQPARAARARDLRVHDLGPAVLRNIAQDVNVYRIDLDHAQQSIDPVCRMTVQRHEAAGTLTHHGHDYWFCSLECAGAFAAEPDRHRPHTTAEPVAER